ncbi:MAG: transposase family protein [Treponema sp.]|jgi:hypothetical protein|nr:transposase family protein [Treponema sp.]
MVFLDENHGTATFVHHNLFFGHTEPPDRAKQTVPAKEVMVITIPAGIVMAQDREDIERYGKVKQAWLSRFLKWEHGIPYHDVYQ